MRGALSPDRQWVRDMYDALIPHAIDTMYVNVLPDDADDDRVRAAYGSAKYDRLAAIKSTYDPDNRFHRNANIKPAVSVPDQRTIDVRETRTAQDATT